MAEHEHDAAVDTATSPTRGRRRGTRRPANKPPVSEAPTITHAQAEPEGAPAEPMSRPGVLKVLWADIRGKRLPYQPTTEELAWEAEEQAAEVEARATMAAGTDLDAARFEAMRRRITTRPS